MPPEDLLEREVQLQGLRDALSDARAGRGVPPVRGGPGGQGKTALLRAFRAEAAASGVLVLAAIGPEFERDFPVGVVRQLFEARLPGDDGPRRSELLRDAAAAAAPVFAEGGARRGARRAARAAARPVLAVREPCGGGAAAARRRRRALGRRAEPALLRDARPAPGEPPGRARPRCAPRRARRPAGAAGRAGHGAGLAPRAPQRALAGGGPPAGRARARRRAGRGVRRRVRGGDAGQPAGSRASCCAPPPSAAWPARPPTCRPSSARSPPR